MRGSLRLMFGSCIASGALAILGAAPAAAQYGPPPEPPPGPPQGGGYYQPQPGYGYYPPAPVGVQREGLALGLGVGGGSVSITCETCSNEPESNGGPSFSFHIGGTLNERMVLLLDFWGVIFEDRNQPDLLITQNIATVGLRYFVGPKFWLQGGIGLASFQISDSRGNTGESEDGAAVLGAAGLEVHQGYNFTIDVSLRVALAAFEGPVDGEGYTASTGALMVGFNWY